MTGTSPSAGAASLLDAAGVDVAAIECTVRMAMTRALSASEAVNAIVALICAPRLESTPAERMAEESARLLAEYDRLGGDHLAAGRVARLFAPKNDPKAHERFAQRIRALARRRKTKPLRFAR